jgi:hypothetical protein
MFEVEKTYDYTRIDGSKVKFCVLEIGTEKTKIRYGVNGARPVAEFEIAVCKAYVIGNEPPARNKEGAIIDTFKIYETFPMFENSKLMKADKKTKRSNA